jgi:hypothetical protein
VKPHRTIASRQRSLSQSNCSTCQRGKEQDDSPFLIGDYGYGELRSGNVLGTSQTMVSHKKMTETEFSS